MLITRECSVFFFRCGHCKKMAPVLDKVAPKLEGKMAIGKIDCTVHKSLCSEYKVRGYPTLKYSLDGNIENYPGGRDEATIMAFATKMSAPAVKFVESKQEALEFAKTQTEEGVVFLGTDPSGDIESSELYKVFSQVARRKQASAYFLWLPGNLETVAYVNRIEKGAKPRDWDQKEMTTDALATWVQEQNVPLVATLDSHNFHKISRNGRPLVVSVVDMTNESQVEAMKKHMLDYITRTGKKKADQYYYGIMDGKKWSKFLAQFRVEPEHIPQTIVMDIPTKEFYQNETYGNIFEFMDAVEDGTIEKAFATSPQSKGILAKIERMFLQNFPYSLLVPMVLVFGIVFLLVPGADDLRPKFIPEEDVLDGDEAQDDEPAEDKDDSAANDESKKDK